MSFSYVNQLMNSLDRMNGYSNDELDCCIILLMFLVRVLLFFIFKVILAKLGFGDM